MYEILKIHNGKKQTLTLEIHKGKKQTLTKVLRKLTTNIQSWW